MVLVRVLGRPAWSRLAVSSVTVSGADPSSGGAGLRVSFLGSPSPQVALMLMLTLEASTWQSSIHSRSCRRRPLAAASSLATLTSLGGFSKIRPERTTCSLRISRLLSLPRTSLFNAPPPLPPPEGDRASTTTRGACGDEGGGAGE
eukprot:4496165-Pyramimonas_sp.AAC.1